MSRISPVLEIMTGAHRCTDDRVTVRARLRHHHSEGVRRLILLARVVIRQCPRDLRHSRSNAKRAIPVALGTRVADTLGGTLLSGGRNTARETSLNDAIVIEAEIDSDFDGDTDIVGGLVCELTI